MIKISKKKNRKSKKCYNQQELNIEKPLKEELKVRQVKSSNIELWSIWSKAMQPERVIGKQIEAARVALTRYMKRTGKVWTRVFPNIPVSKKPTEVRMGKGKGSPEYYACRVKPGRIIFEIDGVTEEVAREALYKASAKLPIKTKFISR